MLDWNDFDTLLLDLDGTLLDLAFDNRFWLEHVPQAYAQAKGVEPAAARELLVPIFRSREGTLDWYCVDHWSRTLGIDIRELKERAAAEITWLPGAREFLARARAQGKRAVLLTNAHPVTLQIKDLRTGVRKLVDLALSSHDLGAPKEDPAFWEVVRTIEQFDPQRTLFVDDSLAVLRAARQAGLPRLRAIRCPDSSRPERQIEEFESVSGVAQLFA
jgi:putative hydrolase of the HAD superfamily